MTGVRRTLMAAILFAALALAADIYAPPRLAVALATVPVFLLAVALMAITRIREPRS